MTKIFQIKKYEKLFQELSSDFFHWHYRKLFDKLQQQWSRVWHNWDTIKINQHRFLLDQIFEETKQLVCAKVSKTFKGVKSSIESKKFMKIQLV